MTTQTDWELESEVKHPRTGLPYFVWRCKDSVGDLYQVTNLKLAPYSQSGYRNKESMLRLKGIMLPLTGVKK